MYGGIGPIASGGTGAALAYTGTGSLVLPLVVSGMSLVVAALLVIRSRKLAQVTV